MLNIPSLAYLTIPEFKYNILGVAQIVSVEIRDKYISKYKLLGVDTMVGEVEHSRDKERPADGI